MDPIVEETLTIALATARAAHMSALARRAELAAELAEHDALIQLHANRVAALESAIPAPEPEPTE